MQLVAAFFFPFGGAAGFKAIGLQGQGDSVGNCFLPFSLDFYFHQPAQGELQFYLAGRMLRIHLVPLAIAMAQLELPGVSAELNACIHCAADKLLSGGLGPWGILSLHESRQG